MKKLTDMTFGEFFEELRNMLGEIKEGIEEIKNPLSLKELKGFIEAWDHESVCKHYTGCTNEDIANYLKSQFEVINHRFIPGNKELNLCPSDEWELKYKNNGIEFRIEICPIHKTLLLLSKGDK